MATPVPISQLPTIAALAETDLMLGVDLSNPVGTQTGKFEAGQLAALTAVAGYLSGNTQAITTTPTDITGWSAAASNFMTATAGSGQIGILQDGFYQITATIITDISANNAGMTLYNRKNGGAFGQIGSAVTHTSVLGSISSTFSEPLSNGDFLTIGVDSTATGAITAASYTITRIA